MAITNPNLEDGFDFNGSNLLALTTALKDDGYVKNEIPKSGHINTVFKELYRYMQFLKSTGTSQWDNTVSYQEHSRIMRDGVIYKSLSDSNQGNDPSINPTFWQVDEWRQQTVAHDVTSDADYTLTFKQNNFGRIVITDTGTTLTGAINIITDDLQKSFIAVNNTVQDITFKTDLGTGVPLQAGSFKNLYNNGIDIIENENTGVGIEQNWQDMLSSRSVGIFYTNATSKPISVMVTGHSNDTTAQGYVLEIDGTAIASSDFNFPKTTFDRAYTSVSFIVPIGSTYKILGNPTLNTLIFWSELR